MAGAGPIDALEKLLASANFTGAAQDFKSDVLGFVHAIDWSEPWIMALGAYHLIIWILVIGLRRWNDLQMIMLVLILGMVYCAEYVNRFGNEHWRSFATQNYFDKRGVFISIMFSAPMLGCSMFILLNALRSASKLLIAVKKKELRAKARSQKSKQQ